MAITKRAYRLPKCVISHIKCYVMTNLWLAICCAANHAHAKWRRWMGLVWHRSPRHYRDGQEGARTAAGAAASAIRGAGGGERRFLIRCLRELPLRTLDRGHAPPLAASCLLAAWPEGAVAVDVQGRRHRHDATVRRGLGLDPPSGRERFWIGVRGAPYPRRGRPGGVSGAGVPIGLDHLGEGLVLGLLPAGPGSFGRLVPGAAQAHQGLGVPCSVVHGMRFAGPGEADSGPAPATATAIGR
jgi:hypothetical protein